MMKEEVFLINALMEWCKRFEGIHVRYAYDSISEYHIVEVDPESIRRGNDEYKEAELALWTAFMEAYPEADLLISEPSKANNMANCLFESGKKDTELSGLDAFWIEYSVLAESVLSLTRKSARKQTNEYENNYEYALAA